MSPEYSSDVRRATLIGASAIVVWSTLAVLTTMAGGVPPFELTAIAFAVASLIGWGVARARGRSLFAVARRQRPAVWALGVGGLFGYHVLYFIALRLAPDRAVEVNLLNYLWPLLIVLFSTLLPGERARPAHFAGAALGLAGTALIVGGGASGFAGVDAQALPGCAAAAGAAVIWAGYSVLSRRFEQVPTEAVGGFCLATSVLALGCHLALETTVVPQGVQWLVVLAVGLGPVGAAFYVWDHGVKRGDIRALGAMSYATPLLSTLLLTTVTGAAAPWTVWIAGSLIIGGAILAGGDLLKRRRRPAPSSAERA